jgi:hypothetical protein
MTKQATVASTNRVFEPAASSNEKSHVRLFEGVPKRQKQVTGAAVDIHCVSTRNNNR